MTDSDEKVSGQHDAGSRNDSDADRNTKLIGYEGMSTLKRGKNTLVALMQLSQCQGTENHTKFVQLLKELNWE